MGDFLLGVKCMSEELRNIKCVDGLPFSVKPFIDITDSLPYRSPDPETPRTKEQIKRISIHHSAIEGASIESYANYHVNTLGWAHIGYHFVVKGEQAYQTNSLNTFSYHTSSQNYDTVSVSVSGDLSKRGLTDAERNNLYAVILTYMDLFDIPVENVLGHKEFAGNQTSCPCLDMNKIRYDIKTLHMKLSQNSTWAAKIGKVSEFVNEVNYLTDMIKRGENDGNANWALNVLGEAIQIFNDKKLL